MTKKILNALMILVASFIAFAMMPWLIPVVPPKKSRARRVVDILEMVTWLGMFCLGVWLLTYFMM